VSVVRIIQPPAERKKALRLVEGLGWRSEPGDVLAWLEELYERHSDYVRGVVAHHGGPQLDAEDVVQDVFMLAHRKSASLMRHAEPRAWLHLATLREVWSARRRARVARLFRLGWHGHESAPEGPEGAYAHREESAVFYALLERLSEKQRTVFLLFHVENRTSAEIAELVGCPEPTVRTRLFHARRAFATAAERWRQRTAEVLKHPPLTTGQRR
jgi:RNA polymerase sigma-70 factor, ECF subfamily